MPVGMISEEIAKLELVYVGQWVSSKHKNIDTRVLETLLEITHFQGNLKLIRSIGPPLSQMEKMINMLGQAVLRPSHLF